MSLIAVQTTTYEMARFHLMLHNANISGYEDALNYLLKLLMKKRLE